MRWEPHLRLPEFIPFLIHAIAFALGFLLTALGMIMHLRKPWVGENTMGVSTRVYRWWDVLVVVLLIESFCGLVLLAMATDDGKVIPLKLSTVLTSMLFQGMLAGVVMIVMASRVDPREWLGLHWRGWRRILWIAPVSVLGMAAITSTLSAMGYVELMEMLGGAPVQESVRVLQEAKDPFLLAALTLAAVLVAPVCEEVVFRGYCYPVLKKYCGSSLALISSSLFFACAHGSLVSFVPLLVLGALLVFLYEKTRSLWAPMAVHLLFNSVTVVIQFGGRIHNWMGS